MTDQLSVDCFARDATSRQHKSATDANAEAQAHLHMSNGVVHAVVTMYLHHESRMCLPHSKTRGYMPWKCLITSSAHSLVKAASCGNEGGTHHTVLTQTLRPEDPGFLSKFQHRHHAPSIPILPGQRKHLYGARSHPANSVPAP